MLALDLAVGFLWGALVSVVNYSCLQWVIRKNANQPPQKAALAVLNAQFVRYFCNLAALVVVYKHMWVLVGTAVGLTLMLKYTIVKQYIESRKHPYISKRLRRAQQQIPRDEDAPGTETLSGKADQEERKT